MIFAPLIPVAGKWNMFKAPRPYCTTSGFLYDSNGEFPIIFRSDQVRSAKNCWSLPSGLHEVGLTLQQQFATEAREELGLEPLVETGQIVYTYENIAQVDNWHWVISLLTMRVKSLDCLVNKEPDKHPKIERVKLDELLTENILARSWAPGLGEAISACRLQVYQNIFINIRKTITS